LFFVLNLGVGTKGATEGTNEALHGFKIAWKDKEKMKVGFEWVCQVAAYMALYVTKYLLSQHLKRGHDLVVEKRKLS
jgi:hypothetical protein